MSGQETRRLLVFTDLDGSLLDHDSYQWSAAHPALERLARCGVPLIPVSSKTLAELDSLGRELPFSSTRVAENGSVIQLEGQAPIVSPPGYAAIRRFLSDTRQPPAIDYTGFGDMDCRQVMAATGLDEKAAERARQRQASEPLLWQGTEQGMVAFKQAIADAGLRWLKGGRFLHVLGLRDKGQAIATINEWYGEQGKQPLLTIGLGDGDNDREMLLAVNRPVIIRRKDGSHLQLPERPDAMVTGLPGPGGWNQAVQQLLDETGVEKHG